MNSYRNFEKEIVASGLFDANWYAERYADVPKSPLTPSHHYARFGLLLNRDPGPDFSSRYYTDAYPDVRAAGMHALIHFIRYGRSEGRRALPDARDLLRPDDGANDLPQLPPSAPAQPAWAWRLGFDAFMLRGLEPLAPIAVVVNVVDAADWRETLVRLPVLDAPDGIDLFLLGPAELGFNEIPSIVRSITHLGPADTAGNAKGFVRFVTSGAADRYDALLWVSARDAEREEDLSAAFALATPLVKVPNWGCVGNALAGAEQYGGKLLKDSRAVALSRIGLNSGLTADTMILGGAVWINPLLFRGLGPTLRTFEMTDAAECKPFPGRATALALLSSLALNGRFDLKRFDDLTAATTASLPAQAAERSVKAVAFYLPQFHPIPENDKWWGKGFTEWSNVTRPRPLFRNHYQPRVPADLGYYDLRLEDTQVAQADLARQFGIQGFCYYYYWFNGKKLLNQPIEQMARSSRIDTGFCVCWANENWSRNWDGQNRHVLMKQDYSLESNLALIREMIPMMKDPRWIRYQGKPVMMVYRISIIPNWAETARLWREECRKAGLGEIHLCAVRFGLETLQGQPEDHGLDAFVLFPPHEARRVDLREKVHDLTGGFNGEIFDYEAVVEGDLARYEEGYEWPVHRGTMLGWDNTARRLSDARIFHGATPYGFRRWMNRVLEQEQRHNPSSESLVFINAWNEWAEGTYLEPDQRWGKSYLSAFRSAVDAVPGLSAEICAPGTAAKPKTAALLEDAGTPLNAEGKGPADPIWYAGDRARDPNYPTVMLCAHIAGHHLFGGERSLLDMLDAFSHLAVNVLVTLPSGNNSAYIAEIRKRCLGTYVLNYPQWMKNRPSQGWLVNSFADLIARHAVDVVHANTIVHLEALEAAERMEVLKVIHSRELISLDEDLCDAMGLKTSQIVSRVLKRADWMIGNSHRTCALFSKGDRTLYVPNAVHVANFNIGNKFGRHVKFGMVSSNIPKKGVADFVEVARRAAESVPRAKFVVVGPENDQTREWAAEIESGERPNNLTFLGYRETPRSSVVEMNVLLNLSNFAESFGRTVAEGMAGSRPVIAYDWGALPELVQHGETGYLVPYRDIDAVVDAVKQFCEDDNLVAKMGKAGRAFVTANFSQESLASAMAAAYQQILPDRGLTELPPPAKTRVVQPLATSRAVPRTTVIVPVYNAPGEVRDCLRSVIKHTDLTVNRVMVVDDGSPDPAVAPMLSEFENIDGLELCPNPRNIGYTRTINRAIELTGEDDVVLLNSDTVVTPRWLEGLRSTAYSRENVATVTAMSDNAGAFSFPEFNAFCPKPDYMSHEDYAVLMLQATQHCKPPEVPTGSGFCMFIRRAVIRAHGLFDHEGFPRGYGEENDFCMRSYKEGWYHLVSPWSFVYHVRTASFKGSKAELVKSGVDVVTKRYPDYASLTKAAFAAPEMLALREAAGFSTRT